MKPDDRTRTSPQGDALLKPGKDYVLRGSVIVESATQRAMAGPEIPHNEAGVPIIPDSAAVDAQCPDCEGSRSGSTWYAHRVAGDGERCR